MKIRDIIDLLDNIPSHDDKFYVEIIDNESQETLLFERVSKIYFLYDEWNERTNNLFNFEVVALSPYVINERGVSLDGVTLYIIKEEQNA